MSRRICLGLGSCCAVIYALLMCLAFGMHWMEANRLYELGEEKISYSPETFESEMNALDFAMYYHCGVDYESALDSFDMSWSAIEDEEVYPPELLEGWEENGNSGVPKLESWDVGA